MLTRNRGPRVRLTPGRTELRGALSQAQFGLSAAGLLAFPVAVVGFGAGPAVSAAAVLTLPLSLSMGAAEWSLYRYRRDVQALLDRCRTVAQFGPGARRVLLAAVLRYLAVAAVLIAATVTVLPGPVVRGHRRPLRVVPGPRSGAVRRAAAAGAGRRCRAPGSPAEPHSHWKRLSSSGCPPGPST